MFDSCRRKRNEGPQELKSVTKWPVHFDDFNLRLEALVTSDWKPLRTGGDAQSVLSKDGGL